MRGGKQILGVVVAVWVAFCGCNPEALEMDGIEPPEPQIVVSSLILHDSSVCVALTRTISALEANQQTDPTELMRRAAINDATVTITTAGKSYPLTLLQDGTYQSKDIPLMVGHMYELSVVSPSIGEVSASATLQPPASFERVFAKAVVYPVENYWLDAAYSMEDDPGKNYYVVSIQGANKSALTERIIHPRSYTRAIDDAGFDGQNFEERVVLTKNFHKQGDSIAFTLSNVSKAYYEYVKLRVENELELVQYFAEPINYPTNIRGGRGFFELYYTDYRIVIAE